MADFDFITDLRSGFQVSLTGNPQVVSGNRALLNHFEITFLTQAKVYLLGDNEVTFVDNYGGNADDLVSRPQVLNDPSGIISAISVCIERTVRSMIQDQPENLPNNEKLSGASLLNMYIENETIFAQIQVDPVETDSYEVLIVNLPVIQR